MIYIGVYEIYKGVGLVSDWESNWEIMESPELATVVTGNVNQVWYADDAYAHDQLW